MKIQEKDEDCMEFKLNNKLAFTLAEVLITIGIIGVVAAMTLPSFIQSYKKSEVEKKLQKIYSVMNQAIKMSEIDNGPKEYWDFYSNCTSDDEDTPLGICAEGVYKYLVPYLQLLKTEEFTIGKYYYNIAMYFPDGTMLLAIVTTVTTFEHKYLDFYFFPNAKDFDIDTFQSTSDSGSTSYSHSGEGITYFKFRFQPTISSDAGNAKFHVGKGFEPYKWSLEEATIEEITSSSSKYACNKNSSYKSWCTALIQLNNWQIPDDYPLKF